MLNAADSGTALRPWVLSLGSAALLLAGLLIAVSLLPDPWPRIVSSLLCAGLLLLAGVLAVGSSMGSPFGFATWGERMLLAWTARFTTDPGAFLHRWAEAAANLDQARERLAMAAERNHVPAMRELGRDLLEGAMGTAARAAAVPWLRRAAERGDAEAAYWLGEALRWGIASVPRAGEAERFYLKAAGAGYRPAMVWLAHAYAIGDGVAADDAQAAQWSQRAKALAGAEAPEPGLLQRIVDRTSRPEAIAGEFLQAAGQIEELLWPQRWFRTVTWTLTVLFLALTALFILTNPLLFRILIAALVGLVGTACVLRLQGLGPQRVSRDTRRLEARALAGEPDACFELGLRFETGHHDLPRDPVAARKYYEIAVRQGHPEALLRLADLLSWGLGGPKDIPEARKLLERAVFMGMPEAHARLQRLAPGLSANPPVADEATVDGAR